MNFSNKYTLEIIKNKPFLKKLLKGMEDARKGRFLSYKEVFTKNKTKGRSKTKLKL